MKNNIQRWGMVALAGILLSGCTSIRSRSEMAGNDWKVYPGVRQGVADLGAAATGTLRKPGWVNAVVGPILLVDLPISAALDTVAIPYDLFRIYNPQGAAKGP